MRCLTKYEDESRHLINTTFSVFQMPCGPSSYPIMVFINVRTNLSKLLSCAQYKTSRPAVTLPRRYYPHCNLILVIKGDFSKVIRLSHINLGISLTISQYNII